MALLVGYAVYVLVVAVLIVALAVWLDRREERR